MAWDDSEVKKVIKQLRQAAPNHLGAGVYALGLHIMSISIRMVPVETGQLRRTQFVTAPFDQQADSPKVICGYGTDYAVYVHEDPDAEHPVGEYKFLSKAIAQVAATGASIIAEQAIKSMESGGPGMAILPSADIPTSPTE